jgi:hypothetical protein
MMRRIVLSFAVAATLFSGGCKSDEPANNNTGTTTESSTGTTTESGTAPGTTTQSGTGGSTGG